jgi:hypothetical protein
MIFLHIDNEGTSSRWDVSRYLRYRDRFLNDLPEDLRSMISDDRFLPGMEGTFWRSDLFSANFSKGAFGFEFLSSSRSRVYEFNYFGIKKISSDLNLIKAMPVLMLQELTVLKGMYRHALVDLLGRGLVVYAERIVFKENLLS